MTLRCFNCGAVVVVPEGGHGVSAPSPVPPFVAERDSLRAEVERLTAMMATPEESRRMFADGEARIRAEERAKIAAWLTARFDFRESRNRGSYVEGRQDECGELITAITNNEHNAP
jgi:hypothetical protein